MPRLKSTKRPKITPIFGIPEKLAGHQESKFGKDSLSKCVWNASKGVARFFMFRMKSDNAAVVQTRRYRVKLKQVQ